MTRTVVAEKVFSQYKGAEVWKVAIQVPSGKKYAFKDIVEPLKALRYMMFLRKSQHAVISEECMEAVKAAHYAAKEASVKAEQAEEKKPRSSRSRKSKKESK